LLAVSDLRVLGCCFAADREAKDREDLAIKPGK